VVKRGRRALSIPRAFAASWLALAAALVLAPACLNAQGAPPIPPPPEPPLTPADGQAIERALHEAGEFPTPAEAQGAARRLASPDPAMHEEAQAALVHAAVTLAVEEHGGPDPAAIDPDWTLRAPYDAEADFAAARAQGRIAAWARALPRHDPGYLDLLAAWRRYDAMAGSGGWPKLPAGAVLRRGAKGRLVLLLRKRLAKEGYGDAHPARALFDAGLAAEVSDFQRRHGLPPRGAVNAATLEALNVPADARAATLAANLVRARWLPQEMPPDRIEADVAAAQVTLFVDGKPELSMRAVVGDAKHQTPLFASHVSGIVINPPWNVPTDIARKELYPKGKAYLASHDFAVVNGHLVQHAGARSSLGRLKFDMPNPYSVYLHDTPFHNMFTLDRRGRSHGCVRLEKPRDLAAALLDWSPEEVDDAIEQEDTRRVRPKMTVAVFLVYRTAAAVGDGPADFRPDVYGWDAKVTQPSAR
jgi:murein L,D-transpeptidase YcbB/YkuD